MMKAGAFILASFLLLVPGASAQSCAGSTIAGKSCCDWPFCCEPVDSLSCPVLSCPEGDCSLGGCSSADCVYDVPPVCAPDSCSSQPGGDFPANCPQECSAPGDCLGDVTCSAIVPTCPDNQPLNMKTCECGCSVDLDCIGLKLACPVCNPDGTCDSRDCGSKNCCKVTRGNDLVCANGCGRSNVCFDTGCIGSGCPSICDPPGTVCSEFDTDDMEDLNGDGRIVTNEDIVPLSVCVVCGFDLQDPDCPRPGTEIDV